MIEPFSEFVLKRLLSYFALPLAHEPIAARSVVVLAPHVDDETISCGGTLRQHMLRGDNVTVVFLTDGSQCADSSSDIVERREKEAQKAVGQILGVKQLLFWRYPDQGLDAASGLDARMEALLSHVSPDIVYVPTAWDRHPDHIAAANVKTAALKHIKGKVRIYESFCPQTPYLTNCCVDVSAAFPLKVAAMKEFTSQVVSFESILLLNRVNAALAHQRNITAAEVFLEISPERYREVFGAMTSTHVRPRQITAMRNVLASYLANLFRARRLYRRCLTGLL